VCSLRGTHIGRKLSERVCDNSVARFDVTRILEMSNAPRTVSERCSCLVAVRDDERTERRQPDRMGSQGSGDLASRRFGGHQTCESVLLHTRRSCYHHRLLVVDALDSCDDAATVSTCRARRCHGRRRLTVGRGCASLHVPRTVMRLVVSGRGCGSIGPACRCHVRGHGRVMVLLLSRRLVLVSAAVNVCLPVGRSWSFKRDVNLHRRRLMYAACRLAVVAPTRAHAPQCDVEDA
jgi:hypothetical protein